MGREKDLQVLLGSMDPELSEGEFVFCVMGRNLDQVIELGPRAIVRESEGITAILDKETARKNGIPIEAAFKRITLNVHSSLDAVGLTAAVSTKLARAGISANVVAAYYHDHVFVQEASASEAFALLRELARESRGRA